MSASNSPETRAAEPEGFAAARGYAAVPVVALRADLCSKLREARRMERVNRRLGNQDWADQWLGETYVLDSLAKGIARRRNRAALPHIALSSAATGREGGSNV